MMRFAREPRPSPPRTTAPQPAILAATLLGLFACGTSSTTSPPAATPPLASAPATSAPTAVPTTPATGTTAGPPASPSAQVIRRDIDDELFFEMRSAQGENTIRARLVRRNQDPRIPFDTTTEAAVLVVYRIVYKESAPPQGFQLSLRVPGPPTEQTFALTSPPPSGNEVHAEPSTRPLPAGQVVHGAFWFDLADMLPGGRAKLGTTLRIRHGNLAETSIGLGPR